MSEWRKRVEEALTMADSAKESGNEGMARVCARRAAGWTTQAYLEKQGIDLHTTSVIKHMQYLLAQDTLRPQHRIILEHMLVPKQKNDLEGDSYFPLDVDLVMEARQLISDLFPDRT